MVDQKHGHTRARLACLISQKRTWNLEGQKNNQEGISRTKNGRAKEGETAATWWTGRRSGRCRKRGKEGRIKAGGRESASEMIDFKGDGVASGIVHGAERTMGRAIGSDGERWGADATREE